MMEQGELPNSRELGSLRRIQTSICEKMNYQNQLNHETLFTNPRWLVTIRVLREKCGLQQKPLATAPEH
jgi:hypothetical protein